jgi:hypothetical protein
MTIEYALTRAEVVRGFYESLKASSSYRRTIAIGALVVGIVVAIPGVLSHPTGIGLAIRFLCGAACYLLLLPVMLFLLAKTAGRTLTISEAGISTRLGSLTGDVPWKSVGVIEAADSFVLIGRTNGNAFFIPDRAFRSADEKMQFFASAQNWAG